MREKVLVALRGLKTGALHSSPKAAAASLGLVLASAERAYERARTARPRGVAGFLSRLTKGASVTSVPSAEEVQAGQAKSIAAVLLDPGWPTWKDSG